MTKIFIQLLPIMMIALAFWIMVAQRKAGERQKQAMEIQREAVERQKAAIDEGRELSQRQVENQERIIALLEQIRDGKTL